MKQKNKQPKHRNLIAKDMLLSGKFQQRVVQSKKKKPKKFDINREMRDYQSELIVCFDNLAFFY